MLRGEPKNQLPFTRGVQASPIVLASSSGFDWEAATIGAGAAIGTAVAAAGAVRAARHSRPRRTRTAH